jgi:branched-subunit amino acid ABC-type transport system permease component
MAPQLLLNIGLSASIYLLLAVSYYIIYAASREFNLSHAFTICFAPYMIYCLYIQSSINIYISIFLSIILTTVIGIVPELFLYNPLRKRNCKPFFILIASLGLYTVLQNVVSMLWGDDTKSVRTGEIKVGNEFFGAYITDIQITTIAVCLALFVACVVFMKYSRIGRNIRAVASNPELSNIIGIPSDRVILWAFSIGSALAAVAGILIAFDTDMTPTMGFNWLLYGVVAMIIGGVGSNWGLVGGALLLATVQHLAAYYIGSQWMDAVAYIILILFLIAKPLGFSGKRLKKIEI